MRNTKTIDIEPTWLNIFNILLRTAGTSTNSKILLDCKPIFLLSDKIRQLQKEGVKHIDLFFDLDGNVIIEKND